MDLTGCRRSPCQLSELQGSLIQPDPRFPYGKTPAYLGAPRHGQTAQDTRREVMQIEYSETIVRPSEGGSESAAHAPKSLLSRRCFRFCRVVATRLALLMLKLKPQAWAFCLASRLHVLLDRKPHSSQASFARSASRPRRMSGMRLGRLALQSKPTRDTVKDKHQTHITYVIGIAYGLFGLCR